MGTVLITGANRGIGLEFARQLAARGDTVIATCRSPESAVDLNRVVEGHSNLSLEALDLQSDESIAALAKRLSSADTRLDCLISNAAILESEEYGSWSRNSFSDTFNTNVTGAALLAQQLDPVLSSDAKIAQISSGLGSLELGGQGMSDGDSYSMSKAALNMLTVKLASAYSGSGRCVVSMSPGWVRTDMGGPHASLSTTESVERMLGTIDALTGTDSGRFIDNQGSTLPW